ncbi:hypothetical protein [Epilithonimonas lactis]|uniref:Uncharacterized protein n=1 Tax=Epilithonimonas lactis TaxID=421072 RepID=A0A085BL40_9FLAO|nr:hypothetical protein [Epilithonimonas lactis]KFC23185.1 hypothetical protein IO89_00880 [Epilithonimonas lactis]SEQ04513.1 hypothetical protein SAMN04488097_1127 [Epilithonimonas lactis]
MRFFLIFSSLFLFTFLKSQNVDSLANIPPELKETEIRIYKDRGITNSGHIFRIYQEDKIWKAELIQWFFPREISKDEFEPINPKLTNLKSEKSLEQSFLNIKARNIGFLPNEECFQYKKDQSQVVYDEEEKDWVFEIKNAIMVLDGTGYLVKYKSGQQQNEFNYSNPESYLKHYPDIDELNYFVDILKYIRKEFNIEF